MNEKEPIIIPPSFGETVSIDEVLFSEDAQTRRMIALLHSEPDATVEKATTLAKSVAKFANFHDVIIVSGGSGKVSKTLLMGSGVPAGKIITLHPNENTDIYKNFNLQHQRSQVSKAVRLADTKRIMESHGVTVEKNPSICIVDDHIESGVKAEKYKGIFQELYPNSVVDFTAYAALRVAMGTRNQGLILQNAVLVPEVTDFNYRDAQYYIFRLAQAASRLSFRGKYRKDLSDETKQVGDRVLKDQLRKLYLLGSQENDEKKYAA